MLCVPNPNLRRSAGSVFCGFQENLEPLKPLDRLGKLPAGQRLIESGCEMGTRGRAPDHRALSEPMKPCDGAKIRLPTPQNGVNQPLTVQARAIHSDCSLPTDTNA